MVPSSRCKKTPASVDLVVHEVINCILLGSWGWQFIYKLLISIGHQWCEFFLASLLCFTGFIISCCSSLGLQLKRRQPVYSMYTCTVCILLRPQHLAGLSPVSKGVCLLWFDKLWLDYLNCLQTTEVIKGRTQKY